MGLAGAILGDIAGSRWEYMKPTNVEEIDLFTDDCFFTDETVLSIATKWALDNNKSFSEAYYFFANDYPNCDYGNSFYYWSKDKNPKPYNSFGNGSAMRVSYIADRFKKVDDVIRYATKTAECTHNHTEGIKGAVVTAVCSWMATQKKYSKDNIYQYMLFKYSPNLYQWSNVSIKDLRKQYNWSGTCQDSVPVAIRCFYESEDYASFLKNAISIDGDSDTICAIGGCIAENYYKETGFDTEKLLKKYLNDELFKILNLHNENSNVFKKLKNRLILNRSVL